ncbi:MAG: hypothetical protein OXS28_00810 [Gammaproteobacteria bacterium]|nr:hypothetical protein [Gammaproteobacteria bacterium]
MLLTPAGRHTTLFPTKTKKENVLMENELHRNPTTPEKIWATLDRITEKKAFAPLLLPECNVAF